MADDARPFRMRTAWLPITLAVICVLYFAFVLWLVATNREVSGLSNTTLALLGIVLFVVTIVVQIPFFLRRPAPRAAPEPAPMRDDMQDEPMATEAPRILADNVDDERRITDEEKQGMKVLEYSRPAKSRHKGAVYTKDYVPVAKEWVLRVETLVADVADL